METVRSEWQKRQVRSLAGNPTRRALKCLRYQGLQHQVTALRVLDVVQKLKANSILGLPKRLQDLYSSGFLRVFDNKLYVTLVDYTVLLDPVDFIVCGPHHLIRAMRADEFVQLYKQVDEDFEQIL